MDSGVSAAIITSICGFATTIVLVIVNISITRKTLKQNTNQLIIRSIEEKRKYYLKKLNEFYLPLMNYLESSKSIYNKFFEGKPKGFRTLTYLLNRNKEINGIRYQLTANDESLLKQILDIGTQITNLIDKKSGLIEDPELKNNYKPNPEITDIKLDEEISILTLLQTHLRIIRLAKEGDLTGESERYEKYVYPREINFILKEIIEKTKGNVKQLDQNISKLCSI